MANDGLEVPIGVTLNRLQRQLASAEARMVRTATTMESRFQRSNTRVTRGFERTGQAANTMARGGLRNAGLQLSQVFQQAQAGGGVLRALAIQLPDLGLAFGTIGIAAGVAGGAILSFLSSIERSASVEQLAEDLREVDSRMNSVSSSTSEIVELERQLAQAIALRGSTQVGVTAATIDALQTEIGLRRAVLEAERAQLESDLQGLRQRVEASRAAFAELIAVRDTDLSPEQRVTRNLLADPSTRDLVTLEDRLALEERISAVVEARRAGNREAELALAAQSAQLELQETSLRSINAALEGVADATITAEEATARMTAALENAGMDNLVADAQALAERLGLSLGYALQIAALGDGAGRADPTVGGFETNDPRSPRFNDPSRPGYLDGIPTRTVSSYTPPRATTVSRRGGGGGGGSGQSAVNELMREGVALTERLRTEQERYNDELARVEELLAAGAITQDVYDRALADIEARLGGLSDMNKRLGQAFDQVFDAVLSGSGNAADAVRALGIELAKLATYDALRAIAPGIFGTQGIIPLPNANGNAFARGRVQPFARGGVVSGPTIFPMANGAGLMGEAGPEGILPLKRINGRLGVEATGAGGSDVVVHNYGPTPATAQRKRGPDGRELVEVVVSDSIRSGRQDGALSRFGARPQAKVRG